ncbi:MAG TPA: Clp protease N-terminal domain-containing protein, partial [Ktedonobacterales bacterium]|nr:Clp protease N-terminal domain-containing protein [Ktedonobacterales bacterium]
PRSKKVLELAVDEAQRMNHHYIGTEHLLLGLVREGEGIAAGVLENLGVNLERVRTQTIEVLNQRATRPQGAAAASAPPASSPQPGAGPKNNVVTCRLDDRAVGALDALIEAGVRSTRSDAAAWLIAAGMDAHKALFDRLAATIQTIRQLRQEAQTIAQEVVSAPPTNAPDQHSIDLGAQAHEVQDDATHDDDGAEGGDVDGDDSPPQPPRE